jgi:hypothetical protein
VWAFSDESERAGVSLLAVVLVARKDLDTTRTSMRKLLLGGERRIHTAKESPRRRRQILDTITRSPGVSAVVLRHRRLAGVDRVAARAVLIETATNLIVERAVTAWTLDNMQPAERARDRNIIGHALARADAGHVVFDHRPSHEEPLLWAADAVCWATGAGGDWRRRIESVLTVIDLGP